jgi:uncharacterized protein
MLIAFTLGITGSIGHCVGMCGPVVVLLSRHTAFVHSRWAGFLLHAGRLTTYAIFGFLGGALGQAVGLAVPLLYQVQGVLALLAAHLAFYFALSLIGWAPSPEKYLAGVIQSWGKTMRARSVKQNYQGWITPYSLGLLWGLLPCGLVLAALFTAVVSANALHGAVNMLVFGIGTLPSLLAVRWLMGRTVRITWPRYAAALLMGLFGFQFAMRGLATFGMVNHFMFAGVMLW